MAEIHFFMTRDDLAPVLRDFEASVSVCYFKRGRFTTDLGEEYRTGLEIPNLGRADSDSSTTCSGYLVLEATRQAAVRSVDTHEGVRYFFDQLANPDSIVIVPGGVWKERFLLRGSVGSGHRTPDSDRLLRFFTKALSAHTQKIKQSFVGPQAAAFLDSGARRLSISEASPSEYDLSR